MSLNLRGFNLVFVQNFAHEMKKVIPQVTFPRARVDAFFSLPGVADGALWGRSSTAPGADCRMRGQKVERLEGMAGGLLKNPAEVRAVFRRGSL
jgi:hypothetical protein